MLYIVPFDVIRTCCFVLFYQFFFCYHKVVHWHNLPIYAYITVQMFFLSLLILDKHLFILYSTFCLFHSGVFYRILSSIAQFHVQFHVCFHFSNLFVLICIQNNVFILFILFQIFSSAPVLAYVICDLHFIYSSLFVTSLQFLFSLLSFLIFLISFLISSFTHGASGFPWLFFNNLLLYFDINVFSAVLPTILLNSSIGISLCVLSSFSICVIYFSMDFSSNL